MRSPLWVCLAGLLFLPALILLGRSPSRSGGVLLAVSPDCRSGGTLGVAGGASSACYGADAAPTRSVCRASSASIANLMTMALFYARDPPPSGMCCWI
jgi:hypothetical protein